MADPIRKLAAIMFTDIAGFTALSAKDEEAALKLIDRQREILKPIVEEYQGNWLKEIGDGLLLSFSSSKLAVNCAIKIQQTLKEIKDLNLRIGIHQGDILEKGGDVFGDDVNIASRIEPFSAVGGIAISHKVAADISGSPEFTLKLIGQPKFKGVKQKVRLYCLTSHGLSETELSEVSAKLEKKSTSWIKWAIITSAVIFAAFIYYVIPKDKEVPSIGILYMENLGDEEDEFWARGITEDVIIDVASAGLIRVAPMKEILQFAASNSPLIEISKKLRVKYLLTSSIYKKEDSFDLRSQLIEAESGKSIYAKKWSEPLEYASSIIEKLSSDILNALKVETKKDLITIDTPNTIAYEFYLRGYYSYKNRKDSTDVKVAQNMLLKATELDSTFIKPWVSLGFIAFHFDNKNQALKHFEKALSISKKEENKFNEGRVLQELGNYYFHSNDYDKALYYYNESIRVKKLIGDQEGMIHSNNGLGGTYSMIGKYNKAINYYQKALLLARRLGYSDFEQWALNSLEKIQSQKQFKDVE